MAVVLLAAVLLAVARKRGVPPAEAITRQCPGYQKTLRIAGQNVGKKIKCPACGDTFSA